MGCGSSAESVERRQSEPTAKASEHASTQSHQQEDLLTSPVIPEVRSPFERPSAAPPVVKEERKKREISATPFQRPDLYLLESNPSPESRRLEAQLHYTLKNLVWSMNENNFQPLAIRQRPAYQVPPTVDNQEDSPQAVYCQPPPVRKSTRSPAAMLQHRHSGNNSSPERYQSNHVPQITAAIA